MARATPKYGQFDEEDSTVRSCFFLGFFFVLLFVGGGAGSKEKGRKQKGGRGRKRRGGLAHPSIWSVWAYVSKYGTV